MSQGNRLPGPSWWRFPLHALSPGGRRGRLTVLIFHRVRETADPLFPDEMHAAVFRERLTWIRDWFNVLPLDDAVVALTRGTLPSRALAITFDDGYADNVSVALPILRELGLSATFFIATAFLDGGRMWNDTLIETIRRTTGPVLDLSSLGLGRHEIGNVSERSVAIEVILSAIKHLDPTERAARVDAVVELACVREELPSGMMMASDDVRRLTTCGMGIGAHTVTHPILASLNSSTCRREIAESRETLVSLARQPIRLFAYPNGQPDSDYGAREVAIAQSIGFRAAFSTAWGAASREASIFELPRFTPWDRTRARWAVRLAHNYLQPIRRAAA